ncbi:MAG: hypothetical protein V4685_11090 [Bacteroidota bacterium]
MRSTFINNYTTNVTHSTAHSPKLYPKTAKLFFAFIIVLSFSSSAQYKRSIFTFEDFKRQQLEIPLPKKTHATGMRLQHIIVKDERQDTGAIFFAKSSYYTIENFATAAEEHINRLLDIQSQPDDGKELVVFIKKLWVTSKYKTEEDEDEPNRNNLKQGMWLGALLFKADCYIKTDSFYTPFFRYDTVFVKKILDIEASAPLMLDSCFSMLAHKIARFSDRAPVSSKKLSEAEIEKYNDSRFDIPVLNTTDINRGVFFTFEDFKNNKPRYPDFTVQNDDLSDQLYIKDDDGHETLLRNLWGYSDGKGLYIKSSDNYFLLKRIGSAFYLYGAKNVMSKKHLKATSILADGLIVGSLRPHSKKVRFDIEYSPFQLDMESGEIF